MHTRTRLVVLFALLSFSVALAQPPVVQGPPLADTAKPIPYSRPLPQDEGQSGLVQQLRKLRTTARMLHTTAHPDDEDGGMLTLEARGRGVDAILFSITRGEGGQNRMGNGLFDALGTLRTLELLAADRYYGVHQRFSHAADFGFSKTPQETFDKWGGRDTVLGDMVRVIRTFHPDVVVSRFTGTSADGHGHHQASAALTREAFRAAADPERFPEQIAEGLRPWQAKKLYMGAFGRDNPDYTLAIDKGQNDTALGMAYQQFAMQGLRHQLSQGAGQWNLPPGPYISKYKLVDTTLGSKLAEGEKEQDFFDGIDTTLPGLATRLGAEEEKVAWLRGELAAADAEFAKAQGIAADPTTLNRHASVEPILSGAKKISEAIAKLHSSSLSIATREDLIARLEDNLKEAHEAARLANAQTLEAVIERKDSPDTAGVVTPGETFTLAVNVTHPAGDAATKLKEVHVLPTTAGSWKIERLADKPNDDTVRFRITVPSDAEYTRPYFSRKNPESDAIYHVSEKRFATLPMAPPPLTVEAEYEVGGLTGKLTAVPVAKFVSNGDNLSRPLAVLPALSVTVDPPTRVLPLSRQSEVEVHVVVRLNAESVHDADLQLRVPDGWKVEPASQQVTLEGRGTEHTYKFFLVHIAAGTGIAELRAFLDESHKIYEQGVSMVTRDDLGTAYSYQPAQERVSVVDVKVMPNQVVGYIMGAGDDIPAVLKDLGANVHMITPEELASADLSRYSTIVLGIRAYDVREDVRKNNPRLLEYVNQGGTLVVQYNADVQQFNQGKFTPYPAELGRERVTVEEAKVNILEPQEDLFDYPNLITAKDFDGWVQERGLYFMHTWDAHYLPLVESHDPGEAELKGGLLQATYGRGWYLYCGYAFFRQVPNGVPGAVRLFVNLITAPNEWKH